MQDPSDDIKKLEKERFRNRCINVAWLIFIFSPFLFLYILWLPTGISNLLTAWEFLKSLIE